MTDHNENVDCERTTEEELKREDEGKVEFTIKTLSSSIPQSQLPLRTLHSVKIRSGERSKDIERRQRKRAIEDPATWANLSAYQRISPASYTPAQALSSCLYISHCAGRGGSEGTLSESLQFPHSLALPDRREKEGVSGA